MIRGLIEKSVREVRVSTLLFGLGLLVAEAFLAYIPPSFYKEYAEQWLQMPFVQTIFTAFLGTEIAGTIGPWAIASIAWAHPIVIALVAAHAILFCTRVPAGEIDRGTVDVLLGLPVGRTRLYLYESLVWLGCGVFVLGCAVVGNTLGGFFAPPELRCSAPARLISALNLFGVYLAVGGVAWLASALSDRRGRAVGVLFGFLIAVLLLNYLAPFHKVAERLSTLSVLRYYRPVFIIRDGSWPALDLVILVAIGATFWLAGWAIFARRDICTV